MSADNERTRLLARVEVLRERLDTPTGDCLHRVVSTLLAEPALLGGTLDAIDAVVQFYEQTPPTLPTTLLEP